MEPYYEECVARLTDAQNKAASAGYQGFSLNAPLHRFIITTTKKSKSGGRYEKSVKTAYRPEVKCNALHPGSDLGVDVPAE